MYPTQRLARGPALLATLSPAGLGRLPTLWFARSRSRRALDALDPHLLRDIGLAPAAARHEASKFFWQA